jgi:hypothetical protein
MNKRKNGKNMKEKQKGKEDRTEGKTKINKNINTLII